MKQFQRWKQIIALLEEYDYLSVESLAEKLDISLATVRRDLVSLEDNNLIIRMRGGAKVKKDDSDESTMMVKSFKSAPEKEIIGKYAASLIQDHDFVWIDAGTTTFQMIPYINAKDITIVTNGLRHILALNERGIEALVVGGTVKSTTESLVGITTLRMLDELNFTKCFVGANGVSIDGGFSTPKLNEAEIKRRAIQKADEAYIIADSSKFNLKYPVTFARFHEAIWISEKRVKGIENTDIRLLTPED